MKYSITISNTILNFLQVSPLAAVSIFVGCLLILKNHKKVAFRCEKAIFAIVSFALALLSALGVVVAIVCAIINTQSFYTSLKLSNDFCEFMRGHIVPMIFLTIYKYEIYLIPKLLLFIQSREVPRTEKAQNADSFLESAVFNYISIFSNPTVVLLQ